MLCEDWLRGGHTIGACGWWIYMKSRWLLGRHGKFESWLLVCQWWWWHKSNVARGCCCVSIWKIFAGDTIYGHEWCSNKLVKLTDDSGMNLLVCSMLEHRHQMTLNIFNVLMTKLLEISWGLQLAGIDLACRGGVTWSKTFHIDSRWMCAHMWDNVIPSLWHPTPTSMCALRCAPEVSHFRSHPGPYRACWGGSGIMRAGRVVQNTSYGPIMNVWACVGRCNAYHRMHTTSKIKVNISILLWDWAHLIRYLMSLMSSCKFDLSCSIGACVYQWHGVSLVGRWSSLKVPDIGYFTL